MADNELFGNSEQLNDTISRQVAVDAKNIVHIEMFGRDFPVVPVETLKGLPPVDAVPVSWIKEQAKKRDKAVASILMLTVQEWKDETD